jgi:hypothetical protein
LDNKKKKIEKDKRGGQYCGGVGPRERKRDSSREEGQQQQQTKPKPIWGCSAHSCNWWAVHNYQLTSITNSVSALVGLLELGEKRLCILLVMCCSGRMAAMALLKPI